jgi:hypothetical protein
MEARFFADQTGTSLPIGKVQSLLRPAAASIQILHSFLHPMQRTAWLTAAFLTTTTSISLPLLAPAAHAQSDNDAKIEARIGAWGRNCKNAIAEKYNPKSMADVDVTLGATMRTSIDAGETTLKDIKRDGLSYNFRVHHMPGKDPEGYCNTDGEGNVQEIRNQNE